MVAVLYARAALAALLVCSQLIDYLAFAHTPVALPLRENPSEFMAIVQRSPCAFSYRFKGNTKVYYFVDLRAAANSIGEARFEGDDGKSTKIYYNPCLDFSVRNVSCCTNVAVCQNKTNEGAASEGGCTSFGNQESAVVRLSDRGYFSLVYKDPRTAHSAVVDLICSGDPDPALLVIAPSGTDSHHDEIRLELVGLVACPVSLPYTGPESTSQMSFGSLLLLIGFSVFGAYFFGGMIIRKFVGGATGYEVIPNYDFWQDLPILIKDGALYAFSGCRPQVVYEPI